MSQQLANHLKSYGRGEDTELVHMTKGEIKGLQEIAMAHGGSLSINPDTGLVEAGFLKNILPMIAGAGLMMIPGVNAAIAGGLVGGFETLRTGDVGKGLMAGLGAYGGAGLGSAAGIGASAAPAATTTAAPGLSTAGGAGSQAAGLSSGNLGAASSNFGISTTPSATLGIDYSAGQMYPGTDIAKGVTTSSIAAPANSLYAPNLTASAPGMTGGQLAKYGFAAAAPALNDAMTPKIPEMPGEEDLGPNAGKYISSDFQAYEPRRPNPYYRPQGLGYTGYAAQGGMMPDDLSYAMGGQVDPMQQMPNGGLAALQGMRDGYSAPQTMDGNIPQMADGGSIGGYSDGGRMLKGPGDGMSDSIPATIGNKQPARLADGEFVVPADVVSHLGNGSTDAGAKHLYSMMDKVRKARTGTKKQGKQIKPEKYMPVKKMADGGVTAPASSSVVSPQALMGLADLSALGGMISNTRGPAAMYAPNTYDSTAAEQVATTTAARPVSKTNKFNLQKSTTEATPASLLGGMFSKLGINREDGANSNSPFGNLSGVSSFTDESGNVWTRNS